MYYHYEILHANYETKLNEVLRGSKLDEQFPTLEELMENLENLPADIKNEKDNQEKKISSELLNAINNKFGNLDNLKKRLLESALKIRGSGWTWLVLGKNNELSIINTANQDSP
ncbi:11673_t:CDS:2 [Funneliformis geosporum]|uniref:10753_t:CDS:1 n=1 Tax=Funneliformis geosporum TaxID=1117311 RepID=A0A9W4SCQ3_9GLOM|nr:11673_t:CDS:2 [Funneliformis geosporum]CAI2164116.1 10753_t:CDS:2 [Funneliformis geosporum]